MDKTPCNSQDAEVRKGPWTVEEDLILINHIANHGEGLWNSLAKAAGLKRTGKSCRLRWLNYLRPDVKRGNITPEEQLLIMELHAKWGNRWSKIAKHLPGRTDNEIKNFWRTRIQEHVKQAEKFNSGQSSEANEQASSSQTSTAAYVMEAYSPPSYQANMDHQAFPVALNSPPSYLANMDHQAFPVALNSPPSYQTNMDHQAFPVAPNYPAEVNENYWSMEDLWLLNSDIHDGSNSMI